MQANQPEKVFYYKNNTPGLFVFYSIMLIFISVLGVWSAAEGGYFNPIFTMLIVLLLLLVYTIYQRMHINHNPYVSFANDRFFIAERTIPFDTIESVSILYEQYQIEVKLRNGEIIPIRLRYVSINDADSIRKRIMELGLQQAFHVDAQEPLLSIQRQEDPYSAGIQTKSFSEKLRTYWSNNWAMIISCLVVAIFCDYPKRTMDFIIIWGVVIALLSFLTGVIQRKYKMMDKNESSLFSFGVILAVFRTDFFRSFDFMTVTYTMLYIVGALLLMWIMGNIGSKIGKLFIKDTTLQ